MDAELSYAEFAKQLQALRTRYALRRDRMERLQAEQATVQTALQTSRTDSERLEQVKTLLQNTAEYAREQAKQQVELLVTHALQYVFGPEMEFAINLEVLRGRPEADFRVISTYGNLMVNNRPEDSRGGGVVDVISLALRLALLQSYQPPIDGPLVLDEPGKHISEDFVANVAEFLKYVSQVFDRQVIMITHNRVLTEIADRAYKVELKDGRSLVSPAGVTGQG